MALILLLALTGILLIGIGGWLARDRFPWTLSQWLTSPGGLLILVGAGALIWPLSVAVREGIESSTYHSDRAKLDKALVEMFNGPPDRLEIEGRRLRDFRGIAYYGEKKYRISVRLDGLETSGNRYEVIATPLGADPAAAP